MWKPSEEESKYLKLIISMATDCLLGNGVDTITAFKNNMEIILGQILQQPNAMDAVYDPVCCRCGEILTTDESMCDECRSRTTD